MASLAEKNDSNKEELPTKQPPSIPFTDDGYSLMELNYILYIIIVPPFNHTLSVCQGQQHTSLQSHTSPATVAVGCYSHAFVFVHHAAIRLPYIVPQVTSSGQQPLTGVAPWRQQANKTNQSPVRLGDVGMSGAVISSCRQLLPVCSQLSPTYVTSQVQSRLGAAQLGFGSDVDPTATFRYGATGMAF